MPIEKPGLCLSEHLRIYKVKEQEKNFLLFFWASGVTFGAANVIYHKNTTEQRRKSDKE